MDLAGTPDLKKLTERADGEIGLPASIRALTVAEAKDPEFLAAWTKLADRASEPNPFYEPWFLLPSLEAFARSDRRIALIACCGDGALTGLIPVGRTRNYYGHPVPNVAGWLHDNAFYGAPLVEAGHELRFWTTLLEHLDREPGLALFLHLAHLDADGPLNVALEAVLHGSGREHAIAHRLDRAMLRSPLSPADYLAQSLSKKHSKELRRQRRRLAEQGELTLERRDDAFALDEWIAEFLALEAAGWKGEAASSLADTTETRSFFTGVMRGAAKAGKLDRLALRLDRKPIAMLASFVASPGCYSFKTAFDESYAAHSPGMQLQIENLATLDRPGIAWSDSCAAEGHPMIDRLWTERRTLVSRNIAIGGSLRRAAFRQLTALATRRRSQS
ncbi:GNAT family N-acetyltransferase [Erythrobacter sp. GH1-10]|uniref:GNAT family N-acetyltransferase n=1 Tax=Erythrobacter sp. GH1-10 TaxID=3349334 RepID=UPI003877A8A7